MGKGPTKNLHTHLKFKSELNMHSSLKELISLLDIEEIDADFFRGRHPAGRRKRLFGGQVIAQALVAAKKTVDAEKMPHFARVFYKAG